LVLRALSKVVFSVLESKYGCAKQKKKSGGSSSEDSGSSGDKGKKGKKGKKGAKKGKAAGGNKRKKSNDEEEDSDYDLNQDDSFISDDSRCANHQAYMESICSELDAVQISKVFLLLLSKDYVNNNAAKEFHLTKDLPVEFLLIMACSNAQTLKKVAVVKDFLIPLLDHINISNCSDLNQLRLL